MTYFNLNRRYAERKSYDQDELIAAQLQGKLVGWDKVLESRSCVIVAPANFGKTTEMRHQADRLRANGESAIFVALRQLANRGNLDKTLEGDDRSAYRAWKAAPASHITVFVDSLDEAAAGQEESIGHLISDVADELSWPNEHIRWVISTRPAVLTSAVFEKLSDLLSKPALKLIGTSDSTSGIGNSGTASVAVGSEEHLRLRLFSMAHLEDAQAAAYLQGRYPGIDAGQLVEIASARGLSGFVRSPGGLDILARIDMVANPPASLTEVFERVVSAIGTLRSADHRLAGAGNPSTELVTSAAQRLAAASLVCQLVNIEMPEATLGVSEKALSARLIASSLLHEAGLRQLLNSQLFIDAGFHQVKVYPDEIGPFLAAQRLAGLVASPDQAERLLDTFTWTAPSGEQGVQRAFLPMMGWLATLNQHCREVILQRDPQALAFFGDLRNPAVPLNAARDALTESIKRLVERGDRIGRGMFRLTSENFWQAGPERLATTISSLYERYKESYWARDVLIDIATACKLESLRTKVFRRHGSDFDRLLSDGSDVGYFIALDRPADLAALARAAVASTTVGEGVICLLLEELSWQYFSPRDVAVLVDKQFMAGPRGFLLSHLFEEDSVVAAATDGQLYELVRGLVVRLAKHKSEGSCNRDDQQYVDLVASVFEGLVSRTGAVQTAKVARLYLILERVVQERCLESSSTQDLKSAVSENAAMRDELLRSTLHRKLDDNTLCHAVVGYRRPCDYTPEDVLSLNDAQLTRVYTEWQAQVASAIARQSPPKETKPKREKFAIGVKAKRQLNARLSALADGTDTQALAWIAGWLIQANRTSKYGEIDFAAFEKAAGAKIATAARQGLSQLWRSRPPKFEETEPNSTFHISVAGLQGLSLEFSQGKTFPPLTDEEVRRALRYALVEINGYPKWFWPLVEAHPNVALPELIAITREAANGATSRGHAEELLTSISSAPIVVQEALASIAWAYLVDSNASRNYVVDRLLKAALSVPGKVRLKDLERFALQKMKAAYCSPLPDPVEPSLRAQREEALTWATRWLTHNPLGWRNAVSMWGPSDALAVKNLIFDLAAAFGRDSEGVAVRIATESDHGILALEDLFLWTMWAVDPKDDVERPEGVAYSPGPREHAERFRDAIIGGIAAATSQAAYSALDRIREALSLPVGDLTIDYIKRMQFELRERQYTREPVPQTKYAKFEDDFRGDVAGSTSFAMAVHADLRAVQYDVERGEHSLRSFFNQIDFKRINKHGEAGAKAGLALEMHFQRLLASELAHHARSRYSVTMESETAEAKRRDVLCSKGDWRASIELKMSERWTLEEYVVSLEKQLVGQYMRHNKATAGFLVLVLQTKGRQWNDLTSTKKLNFQQVLAILSAKAQELEAKDRTRFLRVIGIDATRPEDFRATTKKSLSKKRIAAKASESET
ncbi:hypothetical protein [Achromobacter anxifer]